MNHISKSFLARDGRTYKSHSWELREGGYKRIALLVGSGERPIDQESRLVRFLLDRGFRVVALDLAYGAPLDSGAPRPGLRSFREAIAAFAAANEAPYMPFYIIASSFSAGALLPIAASMPQAAAWALIAPVVEFPPLGLRRSCFFMPSADLSVGPKELCGDPDLLEKWADKSKLYKFRKSELKAAGSELASALTKDFGCPLAAFSGEADPFISEAGRASLKQAGSKLYGYPRVRHDPGFDRYADNYYADLGSFLDEVEAGKQKK
jgi:alpha-beta hydrolase superfamily lysophospholipase